MELVGQGSVINGAVTSTHTSLFQTDCFRQTVASKVFAKMVGEEMQR